MPPGRHVPQRTCVVCRRVAPKRDLMRLVLDAEGQLRVDGTGRLPGRGAYVCRAPQCVQKAASKRLVERVLRTRVSPEALERLRALLEAGAAADGGSVGPRSAAEPADARSGPPGGAP
jgi:predicted RNA-binding protein YlxR (DUF448 family)